MTSQELIEKIQDALREDPSIANMGMLGGRLAITDTDEQTFILNIVENPE